MIQVQTISLVPNGPNKLITQGPKNLIKPMQVGDTTISININDEYTIDLGQTVKYKGNIPYKINAIQEITKGYELVVAPKSKASLFLLPILGTRHDDFFYHTLFCNAFIALEDEPNCLALLYRFSGKGEFLRFEQKLRQLSSFKRMEDPSPYFTLFVFNIPTEYLEDYQNFCLGKYSKLSATLKDKIFQFHQADANSVLGQILYKSTKRRLRMQESLGMQIDEDAELLSVPNLEQEVYRKEIYV